MLYINGQPYDANTAILEDIASPNINIAGSYKTWVYDEITHNLLEEILIELRTLRFHASIVTGEDANERIEV